MHKCVQGRMIGQFQHVCITPIAMRTGSGFHLVGKPVMISTATCAEKSLSMPDMVHQASVDVLTRQSPRGAGLDHRSATNVRTVASGWLDRWVAADASGS